MSSDAANEELAESLYPFDAPDPHRSDHEGLTRDVFVQGCRTGFIAAVPDPEKPSHLVAVAQHIAQAALDWVDIENDQHHHSLACTNWEAWTEEASAAIWGLRKEISGVE